MKNLKKVSETAKKSPAAKIAAGKKAALAKRAGTVNALGVSAKTNRSTTMATKKPTPKKTVTPEPEASTIDREQLLALGAELNTLLFEGSEVEYEDMDDEALEAQIRQDCTEIDPADKFSDEGKAIIAELDIDITWAAPKKAAGKTAAPAKAEKAAKPAKEKKAAGEKRQAPKFELNELGHRVGSMSATIDAALIKGTTIDSIIATLVEKHGREERLAKGKLVAHMKYLIAKGVKINEKAGKHKIEA